MNYDYIFFFLIWCSFNVINAVALNSNALSYSAVTSALVVKKRISPIIPLNLIKGMYNVSPDLPLGLTLNNDGSITGTPQQITPLTKYTITVETSEKMKCITTIQLEVERNEPLTCHYPISELIKSPDSVYELSCECNKKVSQFVCKMNTTTSSVQCDTNTGKITIFSNSSGTPIDLTVIAKTSDEVHEMKILLHSEKELNVKGVRFNYTAYENFKCHEEPPEPVGILNDIGYVDGWYGYNDAHSWRIIFFMCRYYEYSMNYTWNVTIEEEGDYKFYLSVYNSAVLFVDDKELINMNQICLTNITKKVESIHLTKGVHPMKINSDGYFTCRNDSLMTIYYSKPNSDDELPLPAYAIDYSFEPVEGLFSPQYSYEFVKNTYSLIELKIKSGHLLSCESQETLPEGLYIRNDIFYVEGFPKEIQEPKTYHFSCKNEHSITNVIEISIAIKGNLKPGFVAYYMKTDRFPQKCNAFVTPDDSKSSVYMKRYEYEIAHQINKTTKRFEDLPVNFNTEFAVEWDGFIKFDYEGLYYLQINNPDGGQMNIPNVCGVIKNKCGAKSDSTTQCKVYPGYYQITFSYLNNQQTPFFNFTMFLDNKEYRPQLFHVIYDNEEKVQYKYSEMIYTLGEEIIKNELLKPVEFEIKEISVSPELPEGLSIDPKTAEITGIPTIESISTEYEVKIQGDDKVKIVTVKIGVEKITIPSDFYYYDLINNVEVEPRSSYPKGKEMRMEVRNRVGVVDRYYIIENLPNGFNYTEENGRLVIFSKSADGVNALDFFFKVYSGNYMTLQEFALYLEYDDNIPLECHYPFSHLYRYPKEDTYYNVTCNKKVDSFQFYNRGNNDPAQFSLNQDTGELGIRLVSNYTPADVIIEAIVEKENKNDNEYYLLHLTVDGNNDFVNKGLRYNFTSFTKHNCHYAWENPINNHTGITYIQKFHGYEDENEVKDLFPNVKSSPYTFYMNWNLSVNEKSDYTFYVDIYDSVELYIDDVKVIDEFDICSKELNHYNKSINLDKGLHKMLAFVETYSDSFNSNYFVIQYSKNDGERKDIPVEFYDDTFNPALELSSPKYNYTFGVNEMIDEIELIVDNGDLTNCGSDEELPNGLRFSKKSTSMVIEGKVSEIQESKAYHIKCQNTHSITNEITLYINVIDSYKSGLYAYYVKSKNAFDEKCQTYYEPDDDNKDSEVYISRHEKTINHSTLVDGRFADLPSLFNGEYSMIMKGYIGFELSGKYSIHVTHSDSVFITISNAVTIEDSKCQNITTTVYNDVNIENAIYPFTLKYTNNFNDPFVEVGFYLDNKTARYDLYYIPQNVVEYNYSDATYYFNETIIPNKLIDVPSNIKNIKVYPNLPDGLKLNKENGEITGNPLVEQSNRQNYIITIETNENIYSCQITIEVINYILPGDFYIHNLITGKDITDEIATFKQTEKLDIEIYNRIGNVEEYVLLNNLTKHLTVDTSNGHLRITGIPDSTTQLENICFKAKDGNRLVKHENVIAFTPICKGEEVNHLFTYISDYNESSIRLVLSAVDGSSQSEILLTTVLNTTSLCLVAGDYLFHIENPLHDFTLNLTVDGKVLFMKKFKQYQTVHEVFTTINKAPTISYNNDQDLTVYPYQNFTLYPNVTGYIYGFREPKGLSYGMNYDIETGKLWGYLTEMSEKTYYFGVYGFIGTPYLYTMRIIVNSNQESLACISNGKIALTLLYHIEDEETRKFMSLSLTNSTKKEVYHASAYSYPKRETYYENICVGDDDYVIHLYDTNPKLEGWKNNHIILKVNNLVYGEYSVNVNQHLRDIPLHLHPFLHSKIQWSYSHHYLEDYYKVETKDDWKTSLFDQIPKTTTNTTYIRHYFDVNEDLPFVSALISLNYLSGIVVYINGIQVYKDNMDYDKYDENTPASDYNDIITNVKFLLPLDVMTSEKTLIAVELHKHESEMKYPHFNLTVDLLDDHDGCTNLNVYGGNVIKLYPNNTSLYNTNVTNVFLNNDKYWATELPEGFESGNNNIEIEYNFGENNYFYPNALYIESYAEDDDDNYTVNGIPKSMKIQGCGSTTSSNTTLIDVKDIGLTEKKSSKYIKFAGNSDGFNIIRFNISEVNKISGDNNDQMNINKLRLLSCRNNYCSAVGNLPETSSGEIVKIQCKSPSETYKIFECLNGVSPKWKEIENLCEEEPIVLNKIGKLSLIQYEYTSTSIGDISGINLEYSITPSLPKGLSLSDGFIVGECDELMKDTEYEITVKNEHGKEAIQITISVEESYYPIVNMKDNVITLKSGNIYDNEKIFNVIGKELVYDVYPDLPKGIKLSQNGLLSGLLKEELEKREYLLTVKNENRTIYYVFYLNSYLPDTPNILSSVKFASLHYGTDYKNLVFYDVYGKNLKYKAESQLPKNLVLNKENGIISGKIQYLQARSEKIVIRAETELNYTDMMIDLDISHPIVPILVSYKKEIKIEVGQEVSISTGVVLGQNLFYTINNLPSGLEIDYLNGDIKGVTLDTSRLNRNCIVNVANSHASIEYEIKLVLTLPKTLLVTYLSTNNSFNPSVYVEPFYLIKAIGNNVEYRLKPNLPEGLHFIESDGILYGKSLNSSKNINYQITIVSDDEYVTKDIIIKIESIYCSEDGIWPSTLAGDTAEIPCQTAGTMKRKCNEINGVGVWGEIENYCHNKPNATVILIICMSSIFGLIVIIGVVYLIRYMMNKRKNNENKNIEEQKPLL